MYFLFSHFIRSQSYYATKVTNWEIKLKTKKRKETKTIFVFPRGDITYKAYRRKIKLCINYE